MQNEFLPEETPHYRTSAPMAAGTESAASSVELEPTEQKIAAHLSELRRASGRQKRHFYRLISRAVFMFMFSSVLAGLVMGLWKINSIFFSTVYISILLTIYAAMTLRGKFKALGASEEQLKRFGGSKGVGTLLEMERYTHFNADGKAVREALTELLPQMRFGDARLLNTVQRERLRSILRQNLELKGRIARCPDFCIATLKALEQIGEASDLSLVEQLAAMEPRKPKANVSGTRRQNVCHC